MSSYSDPHPSAESNRMTPGGPLSPPSSFPPPSAGGQSPLPGPPFAPPHWPFPPGPPLSGYPPFIPAQAPPPSTKRGRRTLIGAVAGVTALALIGALTAWGTASLVKERKRQVGKGELAVAWRVPFASPEGPFWEASEHLYGSWLIDDVIVRVAGDGAIGYRISNGEKAWGVPVPQGTSVCAATPDQQQGMAAVLYGPDTKCDKLSGLDLRNGRFTWTVTVSAQEAKGREERVGAGLAMVTGGVITVPRDQAPLVCLELSSGKQRWQVDDKPYGRRANANGPVVVYTDSSGRRGGLISADAETGKTKWRNTELSGEGSVLDILSTSPTVAQVLRPGLSHGFFVLDDQGKIMSTFSSELDGVEIDTFGNGFSSGNSPVADFPHRLAGNTMYFTTAENRNGPERGQDQIIAVDLTTGQRKWSSSGNSASRVTIIRVEDQEILAFEEGDIVYTDDLKKRPRLVSIARDTGKASTIAEGTIDDEDLDLDTSGIRVYEKDGTIMAMGLGRYGKYAIVAFRKKK